MFNLKSGPLKSSVALRQALTMVIDREIVTREITGGGERPAYGWVPPGVPGYHPQEFPWAAMSKTQQLATARQLYAGAGYGPGKQLKLELQPGKSELRQKIANTLARQWKEVLGVETRVTPGLDVKAPDDASIGVLTARGWVADYADANTFAEIWRSDSTENPFGYANNDYDAVVNKASAELNATERMKLLEQAERTLLSDYPMIPIYDFVQLRMVRKSVADMHRTPSGALTPKTFPLRTIHDKRIEGLSRISVEWSCGEERCCRTQWFCS